MKLIQHKESFSAFDGKIILKINIAKPEAVCDHASEYISSFSDNCLTFAKNTLLPRIYREYNDSFACGEKFDPYLYRFFVSENIIKSFCEYTLEAALVRGGLTLTRRSQTVRFRDEYIIPFWFSVSKEKRKHHNKQ